VSEVIREISNERAVLGVEEARFWQVHYGLCMANLRVRVRSADTGNGQGIGKLRERIRMLVGNRLGGGYGKGGVTWEVTTQFDVDGR